MSVIRKARKRANWQYALRRSDLLRQLGIKSKMPADYFTERELPLRNDRGEFLGHYVVRVNRSDRSNRTFKQRIYVVCDCGKVVPAGRLHQHKSACSFEILLQENKEATESVCLAAYRGLQRVPVVSRTDEANVVANVNGSHKRLTLHVRGTDPYPDQYRLAEGEEE